MYVYLANQRFQKIPTGLWLNSLYLIYIIDVVYVTTHANRCYLYEIFVIMTKQVMNNLILQQMSFIGLVRMSISLPLKRLPYRKVLGENPCTDPQRFCSKYLCISH